MFAKTVIDSDAFIDMPVTARLLYYDLAMRADDDGFVNSPKKIMRMVGASQDDLSILALKKFIIPFDSGVVVIKHWRIHNYIRQDSYHETPYLEEKNTLIIGANKEYLQAVNELSTNCRQTVNEPSTQDKEVRLIIDNQLITDNQETTADKPPRTRFVPPTVEEVTEYVAERGSSVDPQGFIDFYASKGWRIGKTPMKDWRAACRRAENWDCWKKDEPKQPYVYDAGEILFSLGDV